MPAPLGPSTLTNGPGSRLESPYRSFSEVKLGVFVLVNALGRRGMLTPDEERFRRENNDWYNAAYPHPDGYGPDTDPLAECWFVTR